MKRRDAILLIGFGTSAAFGQKGQERTSKAMEYFKELFELSQKENKGLTLWIGGGQTVGGGVVKFNSETVEMRSQQYRRIIVKIAAIEAAAMM